VPRTHARPPPESALSDVAAGRVPTIVEIRGGRSLAVVRLIPKFSNSRLDNHCKYHSVGSQWMVKGTVDVYAMVNTRRLDVVTPDDSMSTLLLACPPTNRTQRLLKGQRSILYHHVLDIRRLQLQIERWRRLRAG
jgi:hypothetical protein